MPLHVSLDYTTPFSVGDIVCLSYPPGDHHKHIDSMPTRDCVKGEVSAVKLVLGDEHENAHIVHEPTTEKNHTVKTVIYTIIPLPEYKLSAFTVECDTNPDSHPIVFGSEDDLQSYKPKKKS